MPVWKVWGFFRKVKTWYGGVFFLNFPQEERELIIHLQRNFGEEKLTAAEWGIDWGRKASRGQLDLCLCWLKLTDNCSWIFLHQPPFSPLPPIFFFFLVSRSCVFPLVLNHLDIHPDVAVISLKYSEWTFFFLFIGEENGHEFSIPDPFIPSPPECGF